MPRMPRRDSPGALHHVMLRGIARGEIFRDDLDRQEFWRRAELVFAECDVTCLAVALMANHVHFVLRTGTTPLAVAIARLATGYAMYFNRRHDRVGHLFQNRYKTVPIEDEHHLRTEIRYVHLNPVRAGLVATAAQLAGYAWTGHAALVGKRAATFESVAETLGLFGSSIRAARRELVRFMNDAPESRAEKEQRLRPLRKPELSRAIQEVANEFGASPAEIRSGSKRLEVSRARAVAAYLACRVHKLPAVEVALHLGVSESATLKAVERGAQLVAERDGVSLKFERRRNVPEF